MSDTIATHIWSPADRLCLAKPSSSFSSSFLCVMCTFNWSPGNGRWQALIELDCFFFLFFVSFLSLEGSRSEKRQLPVCANRGEEKDLIKRRLGVEFAPFFCPLFCWHCPLFCLLSLCCCCCCFLFTFHYWCNPLSFAFSFARCFLSPSFSAIEANYRCWKVIESHWQHRRQKQQQLGQKLIAWNCGCQKVAYNFFHFSFSDSRSTLPIKFSYN